MDQEPQLHSLPQPLPEEYPHSTLLNPILCQLTTIFVPSTPAEEKVGKTEYCLQIYTEEHEDPKSSENILNSFIYTYSLPISLEKYIQISNDIQLQKELDTNIDKYEEITLPELQTNENTKIMYLSYKKVMLISPRDFIYVRHTQLLGNTYWIVSTSVPNQDERPGTKRAHIEKSVIKILGNENGGVDVSVYSLVDMKIKLKPEALKTKGVIEIKKYVSKIFDYVKEGGHLENKKQ